MAIEFDNALHVVGQRFGVGCAREYTLRFGSGGHPRIAQQHVIDGRVGEVADGLHERDHRLLRGFKHDTAHDAGLPTHGVAHTGPRIKRW